MLPARKVSLAQGTSHKKVAELSSVQEAQGTPAQADVALHASTKGRCQVVLAGSQPAASFPKSYAISPLPNISPPPACLPSSGDPRAPPRVASQPEVTLLSTPRQPPLAPSLGSLCCGHLAFLPLVSWELALGWRNTGFYSQTQGDPGSPVLTTQNHISEFPGLFRAILSPPNVTAPGPPVN